jgi:antitoxin PrlF
MYYSCIQKAEPPMEAIVAERGQITLPKAVRDALGLTKGSVLKVELDGGRIILRKSVDDAISRARGRFKLDGFESTDAAMHVIRSHPADASADGAEGETSL